MTNKKITHRVMNYQTGDSLTGRPSAELIAESEAESSGTGAVPAYRDESGVWQYVEPSDEDRMSRLGHDVITVWTEVRS